MKSGSNGRRPDFGDGRQSPTIDVNIFYIIVLLHARCCVRGDGTWKATCISNSNSKRRLPRFSPLRFIRRPRGRSRASGPLGPRPARSCRMRRDGRWLPAYEAVLQNDRRSFAAKTVAGVSIYRRAGKGSKKATAEQWSVRQIDGAGGLQYLVGGSPRSEAEGDRVGRPPAPRPRTARTFPATPGARVAGISPQKGGGGRQEFPGSRSSIHPQKNIPSAIIVHPIWDIIPSSIYP